MTELLLHSRSNQLSDRTKLSYYGCDAHGGIRVFCFIGWLDPQVYWLNLLMIYTWIHVPPFSVNHNNLCLIHSRCDGVWVIIISRCALLMIHREYNMQAFCSFFSYTNYVTVQFVLQVLLLAVFSIINSKPLDWTLKKETLVGIMSF